MSTLVAKQPLEALATLATGRKKLRNSTRFVRSQASIQNSQCQSRQSPAIALSRTHRIRSSTPILRRQIPSLQTLVLPSYSSLPSLTLIATTFSISPLFFSAFESMVLVLFRFVVGCGLVPRLLVLPAWDFNRFGSEMRGMVNRPP